MATVTIDSSWLTANGPAPYLLTGAGNIYNLTVDVNVTTTGFFGEVFKLVDKDVYLNTNGHQIQVNGLDCPQITDQGEYRRTSEHSVRAIPANPTVYFGGKIQTGRGLGDANAAYIVPVIDPSTPEYPGATSSFARTK